MSLAGTTMTNLDGVEDEPLKAAPVVSPDDIGLGIYMDEEGRKIAKPKGLNIDKHPTIGKKSGPGMFWSSIIYIENWVRPKNPKKKKNPTATDGVEKPEKTAHIDDFIELSVPPNCDAKLINDGPDLYPVSNTSFTDPFATSSTIEDLCDRPTEHPGNDTSTTDAEHDSRSLLKDNTEVDLFQDFAFDI